jgi:hypothetical protein
MVEERLPTTRMVSGRPFLTASATFGSGFRCQQIGRHLAGSEAWGASSARAKPGQQAGEQGQAHGSRTGPHHAPSRHIGVAAGALCLRRILSAECLYHEITHATPHMMRIPANADQRVHAGTAGNLGQHEMPGEGQEDAEAEYLKRMLAAQDQWSQPGRFQPGPILGQEAHGDRRQRQEMGKAQHVQIGLVIGYIHCSSRFGIRKLSCGMCQVSVTKKENSR